MRLLAYLSERWEKEMKSKMDQIAAGEGDTSGTGTAPKTKKSGGIFGKVASAISGVLGADALKSLSGFLKLPGVKAVVGKIAGPVLAAGATALGFPAAAPVLLQYGSRVVDAVAGVADAAGASSATSGTSGAMTDGKRQQLVMEIQRLYEKQKEMFSLVSNILRTSHDTRMTAIGNIR
jgi:3-oxoacyl-ACP reductase-like protein